MQGNTITPRQHTILLLSEYMDLPKNTFTYATNEQLQAIYDWATRHEDFSKPKDDDAR